MKISKLIFLVLIFFSGSLYGQKKYSLADTTLAWSLLLESDSLMKIKEYQEAIELANRADTIYINTTGILHDHRVATWDMIGKIYYHFQKPQKAEKAFLFSIEIFEKVHGQNDPEGIGLYNNLGYVYLSKAKYQKAIEKFRRALQLQLLTSPKISMDVANRYYAIGTAFQYLESQDSAYINHQKSYDIKKIVDGEDGLRTAASLQAIATVLSEKGELALSIEKFKEVYEIYKVKLKEDHRDFVTCRGNLSEAYKKAGDFEKALELSLLNLKIRKNVHKNKHSSLALGYNNVGTIYQNLGVVDSAIFYYQMAMESLPNEFLGSHLHSSFYNNLGVVYGDIGDFENSILYHREALNIRIQILNDNHPDIAYSMTNLAGGYGIKGDYDNAIKLLKEAILILSNSSSKNYPSLITMNNSIGSYYSEKGNSEQAILYYKKAIEMVSKRSSYREVELHTPLANLGNEYYKLGKYNEAKSSLEEAVEIRKRIYGFHSEHIHSRFTLAMIYKREKNFEKAEQLYNDCLKSFGYEKNISIEKLKLDHKFLPVLEKIIRFYRDEFNRTNSFSSLQQSNYFCNLSKNYIEYLTTQIGAGSRKYFQKDSKSVFGEAIQTKNLLFAQTDSIKYLTECYNYSELSKATLLKEAIHYAYALSTNNIVDTLLAAENSLRKSITYFEKKLKEKFNEGKTEIDTTVTALTEKIFKLKKEHKSLIKKIEINNTQYYNSKYNFSTASLATIQSELLQSNQTIVEYFVRDSSIFTYVITQDTFSVFETEKDFPLNQYVENLRKGIYQPFQNDNTIPTDSLNNLYAQNAYQLYEKLILPIKELLPNQGELIIIPDGVLGYIPFDALLTEPINSDTKPRDFPYLLKDYQTSIAYSATLLKEMRDKQHRKSPKKNFLGVAPLFEGEQDTLLYASRFIDYSNPRNRLTPLTENIPEVRSLQNLIGGDILIDSFATEATFLERAGEYKILHLSTHGKANDKVGDYSFLAFYELEDSLENEWLYNRELYNLELNADMVVLSACETGIGELQRGEGIISLARGFSYAGAKSIITSLWTVDDTEAPVLMKSFYEYLNKGYAKDAALRQAKLDYLQTSSKPQPYYWATFIPIGDMQPVSFQSGTPWWIWLGIIGIASMALLWFYMRKIK